MCITKKIGLKKCFRKYGTNKKGKGRKDGGYSRLVVNNKQKNSEFRAYTFIENSLKELGWNVKNPNTNLGGKFIHSMKHCKIKF